MSLMLLYSAYFGLSILKKWDIKNGSELQLTLERRTYLISTIVAYAFGFQLASFFLFVFTAENLHTLFVGAMCAAGTLDVNAYGYPTVFLKIMNFLLAGVWLIINHADNRAFDYPLIKKKYLFLVAIMPLIFAEVIIQGAYFLNLKANIITSCCGSLFSSEQKGITSEIAALPLIPMSIFFYATVASTFTAGIFFYRKGNRKTGTLFSLLSALTFFVSVSALISFISLYFYELPTHHCPFCILKREYGYIGYVLYLALLGGAVSGIGAGTLMLFQKAASLSEIIPAIQKKLTLSALIFYIIFTGIVTYRIIFSHFTLR